MATPALSVPDFFGSRLDDCLRAVGWTSADLASQLECTQQTIYMIRTGRNAPGVHLAKRMESILGPHAWDYMTGKRSDPPPIIPREQLQEEVLRS